MIRKNYHWVILLVGCVEMLIFGGLLNCFGVFIIPICDDFQVPRSSLSLADMPYYFVSALGNMVSGFLFQRFGYKKTAVAGLGCVILSFLIIAFSPNLTVFSLGKMLVGIGSGMCFTTGAVCLVKSWFFKHQGLMIGMISMCSGLGGSFMAIFMTASTGAVGWRMTHILLGIVIAMIVLLYMILLRDTPEDMGLKPFGYGEEATKKKSGKVLWHGLPFDKWVRKPLPYLMAASTLMYCLAFYLGHSVLVPYFQDRGFSPEEASGFQSVFLFSLAGTKLLCGAASDKFGAKPIAVVCIVTAAAGQWILSTTAVPALCYAGVILTSVGSCMNTVMVPLLTAELFGYWSLDRLGGIFLGIVSFSNMFASLLANLIYESAGSYALGYRLAAITSCSLLAVYAVMFYMAKRIRVKETEALVA